MDIAVMSKKIDILIKKAERSNILTLRNCPLTNEDLSYIENKLWSIRTLTSIDASSIFIGKRELGSDIDGFRYLSEVIYNNPALKTLDLSYNILSIEYIKMLAKALEDTHSLEELCLNHCDLDNISLFHILKCIKAENIYVCKNPRLSKEVDERYMKNKQLFF